MDDLSPNQIKQMINMLMKMLPDEEAEQTDEPSTIKTVDRKPKQTANKFDQMMEANLHKEDIEIDKKLKRYDPTPRKRKFQAVKATCRVCGKTESINPSLLVDTPDRYKCNRCSRSAG